MSEHGSDDRKARRYSREHAARLEAEAIAERVTRDLYAAGLELKDVNERLEHSNLILESANQSIKEFVAVASHDMRNPLTAILGCTRILRSRWPSLTEGEKDELFAVLERQGEMLARLLEDLLTISKIEAGAIEAHIEEVCLRRAIEEALEQLGEDGVGVEVAASEEITVRADPYHLERILANYLTNAFKYGAPPVMAEALVADDWVELRIRDCGQGVPDDFLPRLFGKFARAENPESRKKKGTGLGLSIVRGLAQANGGDAWYEKNQPNGSVFVVKLVKVSG